MNLRSLKKMLAVPKCISMAKLELLFKCSDPENIIILNYTAQIQ
jgi:hypothetical protein